MSTIEPDDAIQYPGNPAARIFGAALTIGLLLAAVIALYLEPWFVFDQVREAVALNDLEKQRALVDPPLIGGVLRPYLDAAQPGAGRRVEKRYGSFSRFLVTARSRATRADPGFERGDITLVLERRGLSWKLVNVTGPEPWAIGNEGLPVPPPDPGGPVVTPLDETDSLPAFGSHVYVEVLPEVASRAAPTYPQLAIDAGVQGTVIVQALVGRDGLVKDVRVQNSIPMLDPAALAAVRQWRFKPAMAHGRPVAVWVAVPVKFTLH